MGNTRIREYREEFKDLVSKSKDPIFSNIYSCAHTNNSLNARMTDQCIIELEKFNAQRLRIREQEANDIARALNDCGPLGPPMIISYISLNNLPTPKRIPKTVFISYTDDGLDCAKQIKDELQNLGYECFLAGGDLFGSQGQLYDIWWHHLHCSYFLCILSPNYKDKVSPMVEFSTAITHRNRGNAQYPQNKDFIPPIIVPVMMRGKKFDSLPDVLKVRLENRITCIEHHNDAELNKQLREYLAKNTSPAL